MMWKISDGIHIHRGKILLFVLIIMINDINNVILIKAQRTGTAAV